MPQILVHPHQGCQGMFAARVLPARLPRRFRFPIHIAPMNRHVAAPTPSGSRPSPHDLPPPGGWDAGLYSNAGGRGGGNPTGVEAAQAASTGAAASSGDFGASSVVEFLTVAGNLKATKRQGWVIRGVQGPESISDHMHRMALMALVTADMPGIDKNRCIKMAVVHDVAEAIVGDITPSCGVSKEDKHRMETEAMDQLCRTLGGLGEEMRQLWEEYEEGQSEVAKLVKDFDKVEMILQALEYENQQGHDLEEFFVNTAGRFQTDIGRAYANEIVSRRISWKASLGQGPSVERK